MKELLTVKMGPFSKKFLTTALMLLSFTLPVMFWGVTAPLALANSGNDSSEHRGDKDKDRHGDDDRDRHDDNDRDHHDRDDHDRDHHDRDDHDRDHHDRDCTVCHDGRNKEIDCDDVKEWLRHHPGDTRGHCPHKECTVCHNGRDKKIDCDDVKEWLRHHPGDTKGPCQPTPVKNR